MRTVEIGVILESVARHALVLSIEAVAEAHLKICSLLFNLIRLTGVAEDVFYTHSLTMPAHPQVTNWFESGA